MTADEAAGVALASLPGMGPVRLLALLRRWGAAPRAWGAVRRRAPGIDVPGELAARWSTAAAGLDPATCAARCASMGVEARVLGSPTYPDALARDHEPPAVLFGRGDLRALDGPRVAIVGTRRATRYGRDVASELGRDLAAAGVRIVSGLALGIDGAAHEGVLAAGGAPPVGVVGSGLDVVYPRRHARLWAEVATAGVLLGEAPPGAAPEPWRFPARNRIVAALAHVVVVVESHHTGGSRHTVEAASARGVTVMAVPGPVRSEASAGTNELLVEGVAPARDAGDVLVALSLAGAGVGAGLGAGADAPPAPSREPVPAACDDPVEEAVLDALGWEPVTAEVATARTGSDPVAVVTALTRLERAGRVVADGVWWSRVR